MCNITPTKRSNAQHLVEYEKQFLQEENQKPGNVTQQTMHSYVCGIKTQESIGFCMTFLDFLFSS